MRECKTPRMGIAEAREIAKRACPNNPAMEALVVLEQMGTISDESRSELERLRRCVF